MTGSTPVARLLLLIGSDGIGGIERRLSILAEAFEAQGVSCTFVALTASSAPRGLLADRSVIVLDPVRTRSPWRSLRRWWRLRQLLSREHYSALLTFGHFANALGALAALGTGTRTILSEIVAPYTQRRRWWNRTMMWSYRFADVLVVQTQRLADDMRRRSPVPAHVVVIPNPLHPEAIASPPFTTREPVVIGLGRLVAHKRYHELLMAFARVAPEFPAWRLRIIGSGPEHSRLCALAEQLNVASRVDLPGAMNPPWPELHRASVLVHCAEIEGFCNTIIEGLASGCAVVSSDCSYGPREILQQGAGYLYPVGDIDALCVQLRLLLGNDEVRTALAREGHASIDRFSLDTNVSQWMQVVLTTPTTSARAS